MKNKWKPAEEIADRIVDLTNETLDKMRKEGEVEPMQIFMLQELHILVGVEKPRVDA